MASEGGDRRDGPVGVHPDDAGSDAFLSFVDTDFRPVRPAVDIVSVRTICTNRDLPGRLRSAGGEDWGFQFEGQAPIHRIIPIVKPTGSWRVPFHQYYWRLVSHLSLNHLSITDQEHGADALREILRLYDFSDDARKRVSSLQIEGLRRVSTTRTVAPISDGAVYGFCRGLEITIDFEEENFAGSSVYLLASVLDRFLPLYASINSATRLVARYLKNNEEIKRWPVRAGDQTLA